MGEPTIFTSTFSFRFSWLKQTIKKLLIKISSWQMKIYWWNLSIYVGFNGWNWLKIDFYWWKFLLCEGFFVRSLKWRSINWALWAVNGHLGMSILNWNFWQLFKGNYVNYRSLFQGFVFEKIKIIGNGFETWGIFTIVPNN